MTSINELIQLSEQAKGKISKIYLHHTAGTYKMNNEEKKNYHICIEGDGTVKLNGDFLKKKNHTWKRNSNAIGIALCCGYDSVIYTNEEINWKNYPPTQIQVEQMASVLAIICKHLQIPIDKLHVLTHNEVAVIDNYDIHSTDPDCRWDLRWLDDPGTGEKHKPGGDVIRGLAIWKQRN